MINWVLSIIQYTRLGINSGYFACSLFVTVVRGHKAPNVPETSKLQQSKAIGWKTALGIPIAFSKSWEHLLSNSGLILQSR